MGSRKKKDRIRKRRAASSAPAPAPVRGVSGPAARIAPPEAVAEWSPDDVVLGLYKVVEVAGVGGMGVVYRVRHLSWGVDLAVKCPLPRLFESEAQKRAFEREAQTWVELGLHPNVCACHYVRRLDGIPRVFAEYADAGSLADWVSHGRIYEGGPRVALQRMLDVAIQFARGLAHAHARGLVHRDVKPGNVLLTAEAEAKVGDFGIARAVEAAEAASADFERLAPTASEATFARLMTPAYRSPEQARAAADLAAGRAPQRLSPATDMWSFAVCVLALFMGRRPGPDGVAAGRVLAGYRERGGEPGMPLMPAALADLLSRCLRSEPAERPASMIEVAAELATIYESETRSSYPRPEAEAARLLAGELSNRALSMLDLGRPEQAEQLWQQALEADPHDPHATYNQGLYLWRRGEINDQELVRRLEQVRTSHEDEWVDDYLLGLIQLERADHQAAVEALDEAARLAPADEREVREALERARSGLERGPSCVGEWGAFLATEPVLNSVAISADGRIGVAGGWGSARAWDLVSDDCVWDLELESVSAVAVTRNGRRALVAYTAPDDDQDIIGVWNLEHGSTSELPDAELRDAPGVSAIAIAADGRHAVSAGEDVRLWDLGRGECLLIIDDEAHSVAVSGDAALILTGSEGAVRLWDRGTGDCVWSGAAGAAEFSAATMSADGLRVLAAEGGGEVRLWDRPSDRSEVVFRNRAGRMLVSGYDQGVDSLALAADGSLALFSAADGSVWVVELGTARRSRLLCPGEEGGLVTPLACTPDGTSALIGGWDRILRQWSLSGLFAWEAPWSLARPRTSEALLAAESVVSDAVMKAADLARQGRIQAAAVALHEARDTEGHRRDQRVVTAWRELGRQAVRSGVRAIWPVRRLDVQIEGYAALSIDGREVWCGMDADSSDRVASPRAWDLASGERVRGLEAAGGLDPVLGGATFALDPVGDYLCLVHHPASGYPAQVLEIWDIAAGRRLNELDCGSEVHGVCWSPDGRYLAAAAGSLFLWDPRSGRCVRVLETKGAAYSASIGLAGRIVVSGSWMADAVEIWDPATGSLLGTVALGGAFPHNVGVLSDGRTTTIADETFGHWGWSDLTTLSMHAMPAIEQDSRVVQTADPRLVLLSEPDGLTTWFLPTGSAISVLRSAPRLTEVSRDGRFGLGTRDDAWWLYELDWDYEFRDPVDWEEGARAYLEDFLALRTPYVSDDPASPGWLVRRGEPSWTEEDFTDLIALLQDAGYGWLRPEGVRRKLERMTAEWGG